jgi:hypothetical protein
MADEQRSDGGLNAGTNAPAVEGLTEGRHEGLPELRALRKRLLIAACDGRARRILALDPSFADWPLSDPEVLDALAHWGRTGGHLELLAPDYTQAGRHHARFMQWRLKWDHLLRIASFDAGEAGPDWPTSLLVAVGGDASGVARVLDFDHSRAVFSRAAPDRQAAVELFDAIAQRSEPAWPLSTLGL